MKASHVVLVTSGGIISGVDDEAQRNFWLNINVKIDIEIDIDDIESMYDGRNLSVKPIVQDLFIFLQHHTNI